MWAMVSALFAATELLLVWRGRVLILMFRLRIPPIHVE